MELKKVIKVKDKTRQKEIQSTLCTEQLIGLHRAADRNWLSFTALLMLCESPVPGIYGFVHNTFNVQYLN